MRIHLKDKKSLLDISPYTMRQILLHNKELLHHFDDNFYKDNTKWRKTLTKRAIGKHYRQYVKVSYDYNNNILLQPKNHIKLLNNINNTYIPYEVDDNYDRALELLSHYEKKPNNTTLHKLQRHVNIVLKGIESFLNRVYALNDDIQIVNFLLDHEKLLKHYYVLPDNHSVYHKGHIYK